MKRHLLSYLTLALLVPVAACDNDDDDDAKPKTKTELLTDKNWQITAFTVSPALNGQTDMFAMVAACQRDDLERYEKSGAYRLDEGARQCGPSETGTWALSTDESTLTVTTPAGANTYKLADLTNQELKVAFEVPGARGTTYTYTATYTKR
jgi:hypothetical protein